MQSFRELTEKRRSIRKYTDQSITPEDVQLLLQAGLIAPTSKNKKPWKGDRSHLHHILIDIGFSHIEASFLFYGITFLLILFTYYLRTFFSNTQLMVVIAGYFVLYMIISDVLNRWRLRNPKNKYDHFPNR